MAQLMPRTVCLQHRVRLAIDQHPTAPCRALPLSAAPCLCMPAAPVPLCAMRNFRLSDYVFIFPTHIFFLLLFFICRLRDDIFANCHHNNNQIRVNLRKFKREMVPCPNPSASRSRASILLIHPLGHSQLHFELIAFSF